MVSVVGWAACHGSAAQREGRVLADPGPSFISRRRLWATPAVHRLCGDSALTNGALYGPVVTWSGDGCRRVGGASEVEARCDGLVQLCRAQRRPERRLSAASRLADTSSAPPAL